MTKPQRINQLTLEALSFKGRQVAYIKAIGKMTRSERVSEKDDGREQATVMRVINLEDGQEYRLVCPALMVSAFQDEDFEYVGKCFEICVSAQPKPGKRYKSVEVYEITDPKDALIQNPAVKQEARQSEE